MMFNKVAYLIFMLIFHKDLNLSKFDFKIFFISHFGSNVGKTHLFSSIVESCTNPFLKPTSTKQKDFSLLTAQLDQNNVLYMWSFIT